MTWTDEEHEMARRIGDALGPDRHGVYNAARLVLVDRAALQERAERDLDDRQDRHNAEIKAEYRIRATLEADRDRLAAELAKAVADRAEAVDGVIDVERTAKPTGTVRGTVEGATVTICAGPGITAEELRDVCIRAVEEWVAAPAPAEPAEAPSCEPCPRFASECRAVRSQKRALDDLAQSRVKDLSTALGAPPGESWDALLGRVRGMAGERPASVECSQCQGHGFASPAPNDAACDWCGGVGRVHPETLRTLQHLERIRVRAQGKAVEEWYAKAQPPTLHLTAEDREALGHIVNELEGHSTESTAAHVFAIGVEAALAAVQSEEVVQAVMLVRTELPDLTERRLAAAVTAARRVVKVPAKEEPKGFDLAGTHDAVMAALGYAGSGGPEAHARSVVARAEKAEHRAHMAEIGIANVQRIATAAGVSEAMAAWERVRYLVTERDAARAEVERLKAEAAASEELEGVRASEAELDLMNEVSRLKEELAGAHRPTPPAELDGYVTLYEAARHREDIAHAGLAAVLAARDAWWRERLTSEEVTKAATHESRTYVSLTRDILRAAIAHVLGSDGEAVVHRDIKPEKPEPAAPAPPPLPEVTSWMRAYAENGKRIDAPHAYQVASLLVDLIDTLRAERGGR